MRSLTPDWRNRLAAAVKAARRVAEEGARKALGGLAVGDAHAHGAMSAEGRNLRRRLRAHGRQLGDRRAAATGGQGLDRLAHEVAYEHWHRMLFARFLAENGLLIEPESGVAVSLDECEELAREQGGDGWTLAGRFAERMLPRIFRSGDPALAVRLAPETQHALEELVESLPASVFTARDALGWTYQFWQAERKDTVNKSGVKIGAEELPAVTQLFTERYMVLFLLHNTIGAWRAGRILAARPELAASATNEDELRRAVRLEAHGGYDFAYLRFVREPQEGDKDGSPAGAWRPAAGCFTGWPRAAADLRVLDPCCGSGHFLIECLDLLARLRMEEERLASGDAIEAVLRDNLFGLEIDARCTQIAAFNLALAAWTWPGAGGHRPLPALNVACSGLAPNASLDQWTQLAEAAADDGGPPEKRNPLDTGDTSISEQLRNSLGALHGLFSQAPVLGSLLDPRELRGDLYEHGYESVRASLKHLLKHEDANHDNAERTERTVAAQGMAHAAELLAGYYHLVVTNVPYLTRRKQSEVLKEFAREHYAAAKTDLATLFVSRGFRWLDKHGAQALVTPQNWLFLTSYTALRQKLLQRRRWNLVARLGPGAFETIGGHVVNVSLNVLSADRPGRNWRMAGIDASTPSGQKSIQTEDKDLLLSKTEPSSVEQDAQLKNPDARITIKSSSLGVLLEEYAIAPNGMHGGDSLRFRFLHWEFPSGMSRWRCFQTATNETSHYAGRRHVFYWPDGGRIHEKNSRAHITGKTAWKKEGVVVRVIGNLPVTLYDGDLFDISCVPIVPNSPGQMVSLWCFLSSEAYSEAVRHIDQKLNVTNATLAKVPFDLAHWQAVAAEKYPNGLPEPYTDDPTQWIFHGHPCGSVVWNEDAKCTTHGPTRVDATVLQVAVARLLGYRWPAEHDPEMRLADEMRAWVERCGDLDALADADGIVCLSPVGGEPPAADRLRRLLAAAYGADWSMATEPKLLAAAAAGKQPADSLETWLRDCFFEEHCRLFHQRPFIWHVWDGRRDGFHALVNYHRLAAPAGDGLRVLKALTYSLLGDWITRQEADRDKHVDGADGRLAAALDLRSQLEQIMVGEPPYDLFVRWKPLAEQPIGWDPDINDGVRINIRPFMSAELARGGRAGAGVLRTKPQIAWKKDRGKEALHPRRRWRPQWAEDRYGPEDDVDETLELRPREDYPWFWTCPGTGALADRTNFNGGPDFDGNRWNDLHYTNAIKSSARQRADETDAATVMRQREMSQAPLEPR